MADFLVQDGQTYIFQGDSITDAGRRTTAAPFGTGYAKLTVDLVTAKYPERKIHWVNKVNGGNRVTQLAERWTDGVIRHEPDWVSILFGIYDVHSMLRHAEPVVSADLFRDKFHEIVPRTIAETGAQLLIIDPFYMSIDSSGMDWRTVVLEALPAYIRVARETTERHGCRHIPMHDIFQEQLALRESEVLCPEPVHPGPTGHMCIANAILEALTE